MDRAPKYACFAGEGCFCVFVAILKTVSSIEEIERKNSFSFGPLLSIDKMKLRSAVMIASLASIRLVGLCFTVSDSFPSSCSSSRSIDSVDCTAYKASRVTSFSVSWLSVTTLSWKETNWLNDITAREGTW